MCATILRCGGASDDRTGAARGFDAAEAVDIAPTVLGILGVDDAGMDGRPIDGIPQPIT